MWSTISCAGNPRDMGLAQGRAMREAVRDRVERAGLPVSRRRELALRAFTTGSSRGAGPGRELIRHYTHLSERITGLAREANVPVDSLLRLHLATAYDGAALDVLGQDATILAQSKDSCAPEQIVLSRELPTSDHPGSRFLVRESRPAVGFASLDVTLPWLASAVAGVNEGGLAVAVSRLAPASESVMAPPSVLLVQECLQRFDELDSALGWCVKRPAAGDCTLVLIDASGRIAAVVIRGRERRIHPADGELLVSAGGDAPETSAGGEASKSVGSTVKLHPAERRLVIQVGGTLSEVLDLRLAPGSGHEAY